MIDTSFDFRADSSGPDPDRDSPTLRQYHKILWSKVLPGGALFDLHDNVPGVYLHHRSALGEFFLSSDSVIPTFTKWERHPVRHVVALLPEKENEEFRAKGYTIGGMMVFPANQIDRKYTLNQERGCNKQIADRFDLTLECIRRHYLDQPSPLGDTLARYRAFFALFEDFRGYVDFFLLHDLVSDDTVKFFMPFNEFSTSPTPPDADSYREYRRLSIEFIEARNRRIAKLS
jgi:hypothetical protein